MISTVTTSTVTTVMAGQLGPWFALVALVTLLALLVQKEVLATSASSRARAISQVVNVTMFPLLACFLLIAAVMVLKAV